MKGSPVKLPPTQRLVALILILVLMAGGLYYIYGFLKGGVFGLRGLHGFLPVSGSQATAQVLESMAYALTAGGAQGESARMEAWSVVEARFLEMEEILKVAARAGEKLGLPGVLSWKKEEHSGFRAVTWEQEVRPGDLLYLSVQSLKDLSGQGETYLLLTVEVRSSGEGVQELRNWTQKAMEVFEGASYVRYTYLLTGSLPGHLTLPERQKVVEKVLSALKAVKIGGLEEEELISITARSPLLPEAQGEGENGANLQVAMRYHPTTDTTYLYLGYPLLAGEY